MDEGSILENAFWEMIFGSVNDLPVYGFLETCFMMVTNLNNYVTDDEDDDKDEFGYYYRDNMTAQFEKDLLNKNISVQFQRKFDENDTLQKRIKF